MTFKLNEKTTSQLPAMVSLIAFGYIPLSQEEVQKRRDKLSNVLLEDILIEKTLEFNKFTYRDKTYYFDIEDAKEAIRKLKLSSTTQNCLMDANRTIYDHLTLGVAIEKTIDGVRKSPSFKYIDWENPHNNIYHATIEMRVEALIHLKSVVVISYYSLTAYPLLLLKIKNPVYLLSKLFLSKYVTKERTISRIFFITLNYYLLLVARK